MLLSNNVFIQNFSLVFIAISGNNYNNVNDWNIDDN